MSEDKSKKCKSSPEALCTVIAEDEDDDLGNMCEVILSFKCKYCTFLCHDKKSLLTHFREFHVNNAKVSSTSKPSKMDPTNSNQETNTNLELEQQQEVFFCSACDIVFPTEEACCTHMVNIHQLEDFNPDRVREDMNHRNEEALITLSKRQVKPPLKYSLEGGTIVPKKYRVTKDSHLFRCTYCNSKFESSDIAQFHEQCHAVEVSNGSSYRGFFCVVCSASSKEANSASAEGQPEPPSFDNWGKCAWHLWKEHKIDCELYSCSHPGCEFKSYYSAKVTEHKAIHSIVYNFKCEVCHKGFKQLKQLRTHEKYHKVNNTKLPPPPESRWYTSKECHVCKRVLADSKCLKKHISAVHNRLKPHICNICGHSSARKAELLLHTRQHSGEKPYKCTACEFATGDHNSLRKHKQTHTNTKPYSCKLCSFKCIQSSGFKKHIIAKHPEEDGSIFVCPYCPLISVNKMKYQAHVKDHDEGRIPIVDMDLQNSSETTPTATAADLNSSTEDSLPSASPRPPALPMDSDRLILGPITSSKPPECWMRDDDSVDLLVDTGGITIPAPCTEPSAADRDTESPILTIDLTDDTAM